MKKAASLFALGMLFSIALMSFSSAYYGGYFDSYYGGNYDSYHSYTVKTSGSYYGPKTTTATNYGKVSESYWNGRSWVDRTTYVKEKVETPDCYYSGCYPGYNSNRYYGGNYGYGNYRYGNYDSYPSYNYYW